MGSTKQPQVDVLPPTLMKQWTNIFLLIIISELKCLCSGVTQHSSIHSFLNISPGRKEGNVLFNDTLNTFLFTVIWRQTRTILIVRKETRCRHIGYSFRLTARVLLHAPSHRQDSTYLWYTSHGALAGTRNSSMGPPHERSIRRPSRGALVGTRNSSMGPPHEGSIRRPIAP